MMTRILFLILSGIISMSSIFAENNSITDIRSRRSSICSILVKHAEQKFADEIERQFLEIPISDRFNDHNLSVRVVDAASKKITDTNKDNFVDNNLIASRLVGRWFNRNLLTGECTMDTVKARGLYDATSFDREIANNSARGLAMLEDAGEDLIGNTFLLLNEVNYVDKSKRSQTWAIIGAAAVGTLMTIGGGSATDISKTMNNTAELISSYKGFTVKIRTRLYRLVWDDEISTQFYTNCYASNSDPIKKKAFEDMRSNFKLEFVGEVTSKGSRTSFMGIKEDEPEIMVRKACARAIDENIVDLQHKFEPFRIKTPLTIADSKIKAPIGRKEGIDSSSKFEVLEPREKNGKIEYHRIGTVKPIVNQIWDNRFMADAEGSSDADLGATTFIQTSGGEILPGMLLREID